MIFPVSPNHCRLTMKSKREALSMSKKNASAENFHISLKFPMEVRTGHFPTPALLACLQPRNSSKSSHTHLVFVQSGRSNDRGSVSHGRKF